jgi:hypothetical protein
MAKRKDVPFMNPTLNLLDVGSQNRRDSDPTKNVWSSIFIARHPQTRRMSFLSLRNLVIVAISPLPSKSVCDLTKRMVSFPEEHVVILRRICWREVIGRRRGAAQNEIG